MPLSRLDPERLSEIEIRLDELQGTMGNGTKLTLLRFVDRATDFVFGDAAELVAEVRRLQENAEAVGNLIHDAVDSGEEVSHHRIMVALRGAPYGEEDGI